jgi:FMN phosphatase YigB (HAD superfamily)
MHNLNTIIFDLDGTLLPMDTDKFMMAYNEELGKYFADIVDPKAFVKAVWLSTKMTIENLEHKKNYDVFKEAMAECFGGDLDLYFKKIYDFYDDGFLNLDHATGKSEVMIEAVGILKEKGYKLMIATNPLFPMKANHHRIRWAGFKPEDFDYISCFEENHYCKPHLAFYEEVIAVNQVDVSTALMVGNDAKEDLAARQLGLKTFLVKDHLLMRDIESYETDYQGSYVDFLEFAKDLSPLK